MSDAIASLCLPHDWQILPLAQLAEVRCGTPVNRQAVLKDPVCLPFLRTANVHEAYLDLREVDELAVERHVMHKFLLQENDVLITAGGDNDKLGRGHLWQGQIAQCMHQNHVYAIRTDASVLMPEFFNVQKGTRYGREYFLRNAKQSTNLSSLSASNARQFPVILPPLAEQARICNILRDFDGALTASKKIIANAQQQKNECLRDLFTEQFSVSAGGAKLPWQSKNLADISHSLGGALGAQVALDFRFRYIEIKHIKDGNIAAELPTYSKADAPARAKNRVAAGSVLMSTVRPGLLAFARAGQEHEDCVTSSAIYVFTPCAGVSKDFLFHSLYSEGLRKQYATQASGSNYDALSIADVKRLAFRLPPLAEQIAIAEMLDDFDMRITIEKRALELLQQQRAEVCEKLMMARVRI